MSREYPDWVNPWKAAEGRRTFSGTMPLQRMERLQDVLIGPGGEARFVMRFAYDGQGRATIDIEVESDLPLLCQRSLEPYNEPVKRRSLLGVIEDMAEEQLMPENYEPVLVVNHQVALLDLVEDELLLAVPQVPRNPLVEAVLVQAGEELVPPPDPQDGDTRQPFADLAEQLKQHAQGQKKKS